MNEKNGIIGKNMIISDTAPTEQRDGYSDTPDKLKNMEKLVEAMEQQSDFIQSWLEDSSPVYAGREIP